MENSPRSGINLFLVTISIPVLVLLLLFFFGAKLKIGSITILGVEFPVITETDDSLMRISITQTVMAISQTQTSMEKVETLVPMTVSSNSLPTSQSRTIGDTHNARVSSAIVYATRGWQNTGVYINNGENFEVSFISGEWTSQISSGGYFGPLTADNKAAFVASCRPIPELDAALIGKIGSSSQPFVIGYSYSDFATLSGNLYLRMNDCDEWLSDNDGSLNIQIAIY